MNMFFGNDKSNGHSGCCECGECVSIEDHEYEVQEAMTDKKYDLSDLNDNELSVMKALAECDLYGDRPTGGVECVQDQGCPLTINQIKGYFSSLSKKGYIIECDLNGYDCMQVLNESERG
jgi:hypothetical protein